VTAERLQQLVVEATDGCVAETALETGRSIPTIDRYRAGSSLSRLAADLTFLEELGCRLLMPGEVLEEVTRAYKNGEEMGFRRGMIAGQRNTLPIRTDR